MNVNLISWNVIGLNNIKNINLFKILLQWESSDVYCFQETKLIERDEAKKQLWPCRWMKCHFIKVVVSKGGRNNVGQQCLVKDNCGNKATLYHL